MRATSPILVTGATGRVGGLVVEELLHADVPVRALTHRPDADGAVPEGAEVVVGDLTAPASLEEALHGVDTVFLVWTAPPATVPDVVDLLADRIRRVVFLSSPHRTPHPFFQQPNPMAALHDDIERRITGSGLEWTFLRPGMFASNTLSWWAPAIRSGADVRWPYGAAQTAPVDDRDVAAVAARALYADGYTGSDHVLTGPEALSQAEQVEIIGEVLGRKITFVDLPPEQFRAEVAGIWPPAVLDMLFAAWEATLNVPAYVTPTVTDLLGRAHTYRDWVKDHAAAFIGAPST
jgi:uncharacterized protein YbjT (DUF2867 family)